ncbi:MAG: serine/threonine protein kinase [Lentisphaeria bacterium]|nr:serine/threonine protein kinase [Lentisphaeria bacterium]
MKLYCDTCQKVFPAAAEAGVTKVKCPQCGKEIPVPEKKVAPGVVIGDFLIEKPLSHGGMGEVYVARQLSLDRPVALKVLQDRFNNDREYIDGLFREARAAAKITHPNIVQAYAVGEEDGVYYFAMELIRGETFKKILQREKVLSFTQAAKVIREVAGALDVAWREQKLVHQDIKPDNIMLDSNGFAKLADLGLARKASANDKADDADEVMGTPQYISPEQLTGVPTDVRSDIYSLGATFFQFVTGRFPYVADTAEEISRMHVEGNLVPPKNFNPEVPDAINSIIVKMMARDISKRYQLPSELIKDLDNYLSSANRKPGKLTLGGKLHLPRTGAGNTAPVPAKPAPVPAEPAPVPAKPAPVPAKPAPVPAKPAPVPAKPEPVPAKPAPKPVEKKDDTKAPQEGADAEKAPKALSPISRLAGRFKREKAPVGEAAVPGRGKAILKKVLTVLAAVLLVAAGLAAAFYFAARKDKLPEKLKPWGEKLLAKLGQAAEKSPMTKPAEDPGRTVAAKKPAVPLPPPPPPKPVTRPEYVNTLEALRSEFRDTPSSRRERWLDRADAAFVRLGPPQTPEELAVLRGAWEMYSTADEILRFQPGREAARRKFEEAAEARRAAKEREERLRLERRQAEEQRRREQEEQTAKLAQDQKERQAEIDARAAKLKKDLAGLSAQLLKGAVLSAESGSPDPLNAALAAVDGYVVPSECDTPRERAAVSELAALKRTAKDASARYAKFISAGSAFQSRGLFMVQRNRLAKLTGLKPDGSVLYVTSPGNVKGVYRPASEKQRRQLLRYLVKNTDLPDVEFYYDLMTRRISPEADARRAPAAFWRNAFKYYREAFPRQ